MQRFDSVIRDGKIHRHVLENGCRAPENRTVQEHAKGEQMQNVDRDVVTDFGDEWARHDQMAVPHNELRRFFDEYFSIFPWHQLPPDAEGFDLGCGSGRWAWFAAAKVGRVHCIDPAAQALAVARRRLADRPNVVFHHASVDDIPLPDGSQDFGYSLGVLHHVPDTQAGIASCVRKLKPGAPLLLYLYYAFDNRPVWFKAIWRAADAARRVISVLPGGLKAALSSMIAALVYWPLSRAAGLLERLGRDVSSFPLSAYRGKSFATLLTDARDRFGTRLEKRFTREQILRMMEAAGLEKVAFREGGPYWCAVGFRRSA
jgi:ubiquinone/menaquinone biosynthesis C-methylase UbiE